MQHYVSILLGLLILGGALLSIVPVHAATVNPLVGRPDAVRVRVTDSGLQQIDGAQLQAAGWNLGTLSPQGIHGWYRGAEIPLELRGTDDGRFDAGDTIRFVGRENSSRYSREAVYWLSHDATAGLRGTPQLTPGSPVRWEQDTLYQSRYASLSGDRWFAQELATTTERSRMTLTLELPISAPAGTRLEIAMVAKATGAHRLTVVGNGKALGTLQWSSAGAYRGTLTLPNTILAGALQLDLQLTSATSTTDVVFVDWVALPDVAPAYATTPFRPTVEPSAGHDPARGPSASQRGASYLIVTHGSLRSALDPLIVAHQQRVDTVSVVDVQTAYDAFNFGERHPEAIRQLIRMAAARWQPAPRAVLLVGAGSVRMRVAPGEPDPTFIPPYLVAADPIRGEIACDTCFTRVAEGDVLADPLPDLPIGRFPAHSLAEAQTLVRKTVTYLTAPPTGTWQTRALLLTDNDREANGTPDPAGSFVETAETAAALFPRSMQAQRLYYTPDRPTGDGYYRKVGELRCRLMRAIDGGSKHDTACPLLPAGAETGAALWVYVGHASMWQWGVTSPDAPTPYLWYLYDVDGRKNGDRLPIMLSMTCLTGDWANPVLMTTDERMVLAPNGGAIASLSATGEGVNTAHAELLRGLLPHLFETGQAGGKIDRSLGAAHLAGLQRLVGNGLSRDLAYSFGILGDPDVELPFVASHSLFLPQVQR